jgi:hypothetical protein
VVYAIASCAALFSHYTCVFVLAAQVLWVFWKHREALRACIIANVGVAVGFAPWLPGFAADNNSPTTDILDLLQPFNFGAVRDAIENWAVGYPYVTAEQIPGNVARILIAVGILVAAGAGLVRLWRSLRGKRLLASVHLIPAGPALVLLLLLSTPVGEAVASALGTNVLGARNLNASWPGLALGIGGLLASAAVPVLVASGALIIAGYAIGTWKSLGSDASRPDYAGVAEAIEQRWKPGDVVVDVRPFTPVPLTGLDVYLPQTHPEVRLGLPISDKPFLPFDPVPPTKEQLREVFSRGRDHSIYVVSFMPDDSASGDAERAAAVVAVQNDRAAKLLEQLPARFELEADAPTFPSLSQSVLLTIKDRGPADGR